MDVEASRYDAVLAGFPAVGAGAFGLAVASPVSAWTAAAAGSLAGCALLADALLWNPPDE